MNRCGFATGCGLEIAMEDGTWERVGARVFRSDAITRPALHDLELIPPRYARCRFCGETFVDEEVSETGADGGPDAER